MTFICGGDETPGPRSDCPNPVHDYPLPSGYNDAHEVAMRRVRRGWASPRCPDCNLYGWRPGMRDLDATPVPHPSKETP